MENKKEVKLALIIGVLSVTLVMLGMTFAIFSFSKRGEVVNTLKTGTVTMTYKENSPGISIENALPITDEEGKKLTNTNQVFDFTVEVNITGAQCISYEVTAEKQEYPEEEALKNNEVKLYLVKSNDGVTYNDEVLEPSHFTPITVKDEFGADTNEMILDKGTISKSTKNYYKLRMWVDEDYEVTDVVKYFTVRVNVYGKDTNCNGEDKKEVEKDFIDNDNNNDLSIGDEVCVDTECFYVINVADEKVTMLAKYNLNVGSIVTNMIGPEDIETTPIENPTGKQDKKSTGYQRNLPFYGGITFSENNYWLNSETRELNSKYGNSEDYDYDTTYPYVYDNNSNLYPYVENYVKYLNNNLGLSDSTGRLLSYEEIRNYICDSDNNCNWDNIPKYIYSSSYWLGSSAGDRFVFAAVTDGEIFDTYYNIPVLGVRPVIEVDKDRIYDASAALTYNVRYNYEYNGGDSVTKTKDTVVVGNNIDLSVQAYKDGYEFIGWNTDKDATEGLNSIIATEDKITLYAIYKKDAQATVYYYDNGEYKSVKTNSCTAYNNDICELEIEEDIDITNTIGPNDFKFTGYTNDSNGRVRIFTSEYDKYYAVYYGMFNVTFKKGVGVESIGSTSMNVDADIAVKEDKYEVVYAYLTLPSITPLKGYKNAKWSNNKPARARILVNGDLTLTATAEQSGIIGCSADDCIDLDDDGKLSINDMVCYDEECFYVIEIIDDNNVRLLAQKAINIEDNKQSSNPTGVSFSKTNYWTDNVSSYPAYVYNENSSIYEYNEAYLSYLNNKYKFDNTSIGLLNHNDLNRLGCDLYEWTCEGAPSYLYSVSYWLGTASNDNDVLEMWQDEYWFGGDYYSNSYPIRPVVTIPMEYIISNFEETIVTYNYEYNGGSSATKKTASVKRGEKIDLTPTAEKEGYEFVGWNTNPNAKKGLKSIVAGKSEITLYAIFKFDINQDFIDNDGDGDLSFGDEICIDTECFYVFNIEDEKVTLLAKYNLNVGYKVNYIEIREEVMSFAYIFRKAMILADPEPTYAIEEIKNPTYIQDKNSKGYVVNAKGDMLLPFYGTVSFSNSPYWRENYSTMKSEYGIIDTANNIYPRIYDGNSNLYDYVERYVNYLNNDLGLVDGIGRILSISEVNSIACDVSNNCDVSKLPEWIYSSSYWLDYPDYYGYRVGGVIYNQPFSKINNIDYNNVVNTYDYNANNRFGVRPVIEIDKSRIYNTEGTRYNVRYNYEYNGGDSADKAREIVPVDSEIDLSVKAYKEGYEFVGWNTNKNANTALTSVIATNNQTILYAIYKKDAQATIHYYDSGHKTITLTCTKYNKNECIYDDDLSNVYKSTAPENLEFYNFVVYDGPYYYRSGINTLSSLYTDFYAVYKGVFTATFKKGEGIESIGSTSASTDAYFEYYEGEYQFNSYVTMPSIVPLKGYINAKWSNNQPVGERIKIESNVEFTAIAEAASSINCYADDCIDLDNDGKLSVNDMVCYGDECFYVIEITDDNVRLLAQKSLNTDLNKQSSEQTSVKFASTNYWTSTVNSYPSYVYNESSNIFEYNENYLSYLNDKYKLKDTSIGLLKYEDLTKLGCVVSNWSSHCKDAPSYLYSTSYWLGSASSSYYVYRIYQNSTSIYTDNYSYYSYPIRPVVTIPINYVLNVPTEYNVRYNYSRNGGSSATLTNATVEEGQEIDLTPTAEKEGWEFVGWNTNPNAKTALTSLTIGDKAVTLYAIYRFDKDINYTYYAGEIKTINRSYTFYNNQLLDFEIPNEVTNSKGPSNNKYVGLSNAPNSSEIVKVTKDYSNYYAIYSDADNTARYRATFDKESTITSIGSTSLTCDTYYLLYDSEYQSKCLITLPNIVLSDSDYEIDGWFDEYTKVGNSGDPYNLSSNVTLTARIKKLDYSVFKTGETINYWLKRTSGGYYYLNQSDSKIKKIKRSDNINNSYKTDTYTVSLPESKYPIYMWFNNSDSTFYWYSMDDIVYFNEDSSYFFSRLYAINEIDFSGISSEHIKNASYMFASVGYESSNFNLDLGDEFDTSNITDMTGMFASAGKNDTSFTLNLGSEFDTSNVTDMTSMFSQTGYTNSEFTLDLGNNFDTSNVTSMNSMFNETAYNSNKFTLNFGDKFDTSNVTDMSKMFRLIARNSTTFTLDVSKLNTSNVADMSNMFTAAGYSSTVFELNLGSNFDTSKVTNMSGIFSSVGYNNKNFSIDLGNNFDTSNTTDMSYMFNSTGYNSKTFTLDLGDNFDTSKVTDMSYMFTGTGYNSTEFTIDLKDKFDTSNVTNMSYMFSEAGYNSTEFTIDLKDKFDTSNVTNMSYMFNRIGVFNPNFDLNLSCNFKTPNVTNMSRMFYQTGSANKSLKYNLSSFDFTNVQYYTDMFYGTSILFDADRKIYVKDSSDRGWITGKNSTAGGCKYYTCLKNENVEINNICNTPIKNSITYNYSYNGGSSSTATSTKLYAGEEVDLTPTATKKNWEFVGWNTDKSATTALTSLTMPNEELILYAIYRYDRTKNYTYYDGEAVKTINKNYSFYNKETISYNIPDEVTTSKGPDNSEYRGLSNEYNSNKLVNVSDLYSNYYAVYGGTSDSSNNYTIDFEKEDGISSIGSTSITCVSYYLLNDIEYNKSCSITLPYISSNYDIDGWYNGDTKIGNARDSIPITDNMTLIAKIKRKDYTYFNTGATVNSKMKTLAKGSSVSYTSSDSIITDIKRSDTIDNNYKINNNLVSPYDSKYPIYMWYDDDNTTIYWYSEDLNVYYNSNSSYFYNNLTNLNNINLDDIYSDKTTNMMSMFASAGYSSLSFNLDFGSKFNTSNVTNMASMFSGTGYSSLSFSITLGDKFNTSNVTNMSSMFGGTGHYSTVFTLDLGNNFDTSKVTNMSNMFGGTGHDSTVFTLNLGDKFDTSKVTNMSSMFHNSGYSSTKMSLDLGDKFNTSKVTDMSSMFHNTGYNSTEFTLTLGSEFDTSNVTNMSSMFASTGYNSKIFTLDLGDKFNTSKVTDMSSMFNMTGYSSEIFTLNLRDKFDTSKVTNMYTMFYYAGYSSPIFTLDLGNNFDTSKVTDMAGMFATTGYNSKVLSINLGDKFDTSNVTNTAMMFSQTGYSNLNFTLDLGDKFDTSKVKNMGSMFEETGYKSTVFTLNLGDKFDTSSSNFTDSMFSKTGYNSTIFTLDLGDKFDTSNVGHMYNMFYQTGYKNPSFTLDLGCKFYTSNVSSVVNMFSSVGASNNNLILDLSSVDFSNISSSTNYKNIFANIKTTTTIYVKDSSVQTWVTQKHSNLTTSNVLIGGKCVSGGTTPTPTEEEEEVELPTSTCSIRGNTLRNGSTWTDSHGHTQSQYYQRYCTDSSGNLREATSADGGSRICSLYPYGVAQGWYIIDDSGM